MKDKLEQLKQLNNILDKLENPVVVENKKLKKILDRRISLCQDETKNNSMNILQK